MMWEFILAWPARKFCKKMVCSRAFVLVMAGLLTLNYYWWGLAFCQIWELPQMLVLTPVTALLWMG